MRPVAGETVPGIPMPTGAVVPIACSNRADQGDNRINRAAIILCRRGDTMAKTHRAAGVYGGSFDLGAAKIDADAKSC